jgi:hypothetical protein
MAVLVLLSIFLQLVQRVSMCRGSRVSRIPHALVDRVRLFGRGSFGVNHLGSYVISFNPQQGCSVEMIKA